MNQEMKDDAPTSFGSFKPVGHVMLGLPTKPAADAVTLSLLNEGFSAEDVTSFSPRESIEEMREMIDNASGLAGFGSEIGLMRRYLALAQEGYAWLLVKADSNEQAQAAADVAKREGATLAVHYKRMIVEELI